MVGESGCGKSVTMMSFLGLIRSPPGEVVAGEAIYNERDLLKLDKEQLRQIRGKNISIIFQDPMTSFNPVMPIGRQVAEPLEIHDRAGKAEALAKAAEMLSLVGIPDARERLSHYPHQFSGGMRQRAMIAMALICNPELLIADETTTALDVTVQAQIVELVQELQERFGMAVIWGTHDLGVVAGIADRVAVMYGGRIIEEAPVEDLYENPQHPYTRGLLASLPRIARALALEPSFVVCDEPISALDVSVQAQVLNLLKDLQKRMGLTYLFIAHDIPGKPIEELQEESGIKDSLKLASNETPLVSPLARQAICKESEWANTYPEGLSTELRRKLAGKLKIDPDMLLVSCGANNVILLIGQAFIDVGDEVILADLTFPAYETITRIMQL